MVAPSAAPFVVVLVRVTGPVICVGHQFGTVDDVPLGVVQVGESGGEQTVLFPVDVVVQQGDQRRDPGQVARVDGRQVGVQLVVFGTE